MSEDHLAVVLPAIAHPLANRFYRAHRSRMRARGHHLVLVLQGPCIHAALCLQPMAQGTWLTNLLVAPERRGAGCARRLLSAARARVSGPIWLFCHPDLEPLYAKAGYRACETLPEALAAKLERYRQAKRLISMVNPG